MAVKKNVFASKSERLNFSKLERTWGDKYSIYHNLPFLNVFEINDLYDYSDWQNIKRVHLSSIDIQRLKKTSIDYTLCDKNDTPILCIEFDGLQEGFNIGTSYSPDRNHYHNQDPWRKKITELKLKVAYGSKFPFFVVGSKQFRNLLVDEKFTIVDGLIGTVLAQNESSARFSEPFDPIEVGYDQEQFDVLSSWEQHEIVQDWAIGVEVDSEFQNNPITRRAWMLMTELGIRSNSYQFLQHPSVEGVTDIRDRIKFLKNTILDGCSVTIESPDLGRATSVVWLPNYNQIGYSMLGFLEDLGLLTACLKLQKNGEQKRG
jgi:hypothetical protein